MEGFARRAGFILIAMKATWELFHYDEWATAVFWILVPVMLGACIAHSAVRTGLDDGRIRGRAVRPS